MSPNRPSGTVCREDRAGGKQRDEGLVRSHIAVREAEEGYGVSGLQGCSLGAHAVDAPACIKYYGI